MTVIARLAPDEVGDATPADVDDAVPAIARGEIVVAVDSPERENEGDLVMAAETITPAAVNFMATHGRGLVCVALERERLAELSIPPMVAHNEDALSTAFHVSVDREGITTTGVSAADRARTIAALADPTSTRTSFRRPGHVFPLAYREGGVLKRPGHTEASVDLARLAGLPPAGVICEIAAPNGEMARLPTLFEFATRHGLLVVAISDLIEQRRRQEHLVERIAETSLPLDHGVFRLFAYRDLVDGSEHLALVLGKPWASPGARVHVHLPCLEGDAFRSRLCACGRQLDDAFAAIGAERRGAVVYLRSPELAHGSAVATHPAAAQILHDLGIQQFRRAGDASPEQIHLLEGTRA